MSRAEQVDLPRANSTPIERPESLRLMWWNVQAFLHFDPGKVAMDRWPSTPDEFFAKLESVARVLTQYVKDVGQPDVIGLAEVSGIAANRLRDEALPGYKVLSLDLVPAKPSLQVAFIYRDLPQFAELDPITTDFTPRTTRPMAALDFRQDDQCIRMIAAHWPPFEKQSKRNREKLAERLQHYCYKFLHGDDDPGSQKHVLVMGDFNNQPYETMETHVEATSSRSRSRASLHYADHDAGRVRLYNCGWRLLGERTPYGGIPCADVAGSYLLDDTTWRTPDQILVSGGLLSHSLPYLAEESVAIYVNGDLVDDNSRTRPFIWKPGAATGVSDHLPISARIVL